MPELKLYESHGTEYFSTNEASEPDADDVAAAFSKTIFWNYLDPWPGDRNKEPEWPLVVSLKKDADPDERRLKASVGWEGGELYLPVATMRPIAKGEDAESGITTNEVAFVANLPVYIPALLGEIKRLRSALRDAIAYLHRGVPTDCGRCGTPGASCDDGCEDAARFRAAREKWLSLVPDGARRTVAV